MRTSAGQTGGAAPSSTSENFASSVERLSPSKFRPADIYALQSCDGKIIIYDDNNVFFLCVYSG